MGHLVVALIAFLVSHTIPAVPPLRRGLVGLLSERGYLIAYSILSLAVLAWVAWAYHAAPYLEVWSQQVWMRWLPVLVMPFACILAVAGLTTPNPFSVGPGAKGFKADRPGILRLTRHPALWAFVLWAGVHLVPNGDAASLLLFGLLLALSLGGLFLVEKKGRAKLGTAWNEMSARTSRAPRIVLSEIRLWRIAVGLAVFSTLLALHSPLLGVWPLP